MSSFNVTRPQNLRDHHEVQALLHSGHVVEIAGAYIGSDLCQSPESRARLVSMAHPNSVAIATTALWIYSGFVVGKSREKLDVMSRESSYASSKQYIQSDISAFGNLGVTTMERTMIDLLLEDIPSGIEGVLHLMACGASIGLARTRAHSLTDLHGLRRVRLTLDQLASTRASPVRFDPVTR